MKRRRPVRRSLKRPVAAVVSTTVFDLHGPSLVGRWRRRGSAAVIHPAPGESQKLRTSADLSIRLWPWARRPDRGLRRRGDRRPHRLRGGDLQARRRLRARSRPPLWPGWDSSVGARPPLIRRAAEPDRAFGSRAWCWPTSACWTICRAGDGLRLCRVFQIRPLGRRRHVLGRGWRRTGPRCWPASLSPGPMRCGARGDEGRNRRRDEREVRPGPPLNLGHTFAHALRARPVLAKPLKHGEAVAIGWPWCFGGTRPASDSGEARRHGHAAFRPFSAHRSFFATP